MARIPDALMIQALGLISSNIKASTDFTGRAGYSRLPTLWLKMWYQQKTVKTLLSEAFIAEPVPGTTLGAALGMGLSFS